MNVIAVNSLKGLSTIVRPKQRHTQHIHFIGILGGNPYLPKIVSVRVIQVVYIVFIGFLPCFTAVCTAVNLSAYNRRIKQVGVGIF